MEMARLSYLHLLIPSCVKGDAREKNIQDHYDHKTLTARNVFAATWLQQRDLRPSLPSRQLLCLF